MNDMHDSHATPDRSDRAARTNGAASAKSDQAKIRKPSHATSERPSQAEKLVAITVELETAKVVRIEGVDASGARHELSKTDREVILNRASDGRIEDFVERAFEAGLACVLDDDPTSAATEESPDDAELRRRLLAPLIDRSGVRRLTERAVLDRAILSTLIDHATKRS